MKSNAKTLTNPLINQVVKPFDAQLILSALNLTEKQNAFASMDMNSMTVALAYAVMIGAKVGLQFDVDIPLPRLFCRDNYSPRQKNRKPLERCKTNYSSSSC